jgi:hypothetical protein
MHPRAYLPPVAEDFREENKQQRRVDRYYKKLNMGHDITFLRTME